MVPTLGLGAEDPWRPPLLSASALRTLFVLSGCGLEEAQIYGGPFQVGQRPEFTAEDLGFHRGVDYGTVGRGDVEAAGIIEGGSWNKRGRHGG